jgi:hypothetical protein
MSFSPVYLIPGAAPNATSTPETTATAASEAGRNTFHPSRINWS